MGVFLQDRRLCTDVFFIRAQSAIRADGAPSAQVLSPQFEVFSGIRNVGVRALRAPRANHGFGTDEKRIRTKSMVLDKNKPGSGADR
ncbi:MAG: hypothetical protein Q8Q16_07970 [Betaproteobacteria bacterium]|nr:hypothetical protein [Betaproteobacteria bacterium]